MNIFPYFDIAPQRFPDFFPEIDDGFISALADNADSVILEVDVFDIQTDAFGHTDAGSQQQSHERQVAFLCFIVIIERLSGQMGAAVFNQIQQLSHLIRFESNDRSLMEMFSFP